MWYKTDYALDDQGKTFKEYLKFFDRHKTAYNNNTQLEKRFAEWEDKIVAWDMFGGEPMIVPMFFNILDQAVSNKNVGDKTFHVHTNGMVYAEGLMDKFSKFKQATMGFSVDAIGTKNDYIRYGSKWENIIGNLNNYVKDSEKYENIQLAVRTTFTPWNIYHYDETFDYFQKLGIIPSGTWCWDEPWNDVRYLPKKIKDAVLEKLSKYNSKDKKWIGIFDHIKKWMATEPSDYSEKQNSFIEFNTKIDNIRKEKFDDVFPEYSKLFA
jgi:MoaA/NifB/PqqE/SkfB family radical SAM enzyme